MSTQSLPDFTVYKGTIAKIALLKASEQDIHRSLCK